MWFSGFFSDFSAHALRPCATFFAVLHVCLLKSWELTKQSIAQGGGCAPIFVSWIENKISNVWERLCPYILKIIFDSGHETRCAALRNGIQHDARFWDLHTRHMQKSLYRLNAWQEKSEKNPGGHARGEKPAYQVSGKTLQHRLRNREKTSKKHEKNTKKHENRAKNWS